MTIQENIQAVEQAKQQLATQQLELVGAQLPQPTAMQLMRPINSPIAAMIGRQQQNLSFTTAKGEALQQIGTQQGQVQAYEKQFQDYLKTPSGIRQYVYDTGGKPEIRYENVGFKGESQQYPVLIYKSPFGTFEDRSAVQQALKQSEFQSDVSNRELTPENITMLQAKYNIPFSVAASVLNYMQPKIQQTATAPTSLSIPNQNLLKTYPNVVLNVKQAPVNLPYQTRGTSFIQAEPGNIRFITPPAPLTEATTPKPSFAFNVLGTAANYPMLGSLINQPLTEKTQMQLFGDTNKPGIINALSKEFSIINPITRYQAFKEGQTISGNLPPYNQILSAINPLIDQQNKISVQQKDISSQTEILNRNIEDKTKQFQSGKITIGAYQQSYNDYIQKFNKLNTNFEDLTRQYKEKEAQVKVLEANTNYKTIAQLEKERGSISTISSKLGGSELKKGVVTGLSYGVEAGSFFTPFRYVQSPFFVSEGIGNIQKGNILTGAAEIGGGALLLAPEIKALVSPLTSSFSAVASRIPFLSSAPMRFLGKTAAIGGAVTLGGVYAGTNALQTFGSSGSLGAGIGAGVGSIGGLVGGSIATGYFNPKQIISRTEARQFEEVPLKITGTRNIFGETGAGIDILRGEKVLPSGLKYVSFLEQPFQANEPGTRINLFKGIGSAIRIEPSKGVGLGLPILKENKVIGGTFITGGEIFIVPRQPVLMQPLKTDTSIPGFLFGNPELYKTTKLPGTTGSYGEILTTPVEKIKGNILTGYKITEKTINPFDVNFLRLEPKARGNIFTSEVSRPKTTIDYFAGLSKQRIEPGKQEEFVFQRNIPIKEIGRITEKDVKIKTIPVRYGSIIDKNPPEPLTYLDIIGGKPKAVVQNVRPTAFRYTNEKGLIDLSLKKLKGTLEIMKAASSTSTALTPTELRLRKVSELGSVKVNIIRLNDVGDTTRDISQFIIKKPLTRLQIERLPEAERLVQLENSQGLRLQQREASQILEKPKQQFKIFDVSYSKAALETMQRQLIPKSSIISPIVSVSVAQTKQLPVKAEIQTTAQVSKEKQVDYLGTKSLSVSREEQRQNPFMSSAQPQALIQQQNQRQKQEQRQKQKQEQKQEQVQQQIQQQRENKFGFGFPPTYHYEKGKRLKVRAEPSEFSIYERRGRGRAARLIPVGYEKNLVSASVLGLKKVKSNLGSTFFIKSNGRFVRPVIVSPELRPLKRNPFGLTQRRGTRLKTPQEIIQIQQSRKRRKNLFF